MRFLISRIVSANQIVGRSISDFSNQLITRSSRVSYVCRFQPPWVSNKEKWFTRVIYLFVSNIHSHIYLWILHIKLFIVPEGDAPILVEGLTDVTVGLKETIALKCSINRGKPAADIKWSV